MLIFWKLYGILSICSISMIWMDFPHFDEFQDFDGFRRCRSIWHNALMLPRRWFGTMPFCSKFKQIHDRLCSHIGAKLQQRRFVFLEPSFQLLPSTIKLWNSINCMDFLNFHVFPKCSFISTHFADFDEFLWIWMNLCCFAGLPCIVWISQIYMGPRVSIGFCDFDELRRDSTCCNSKKLTWLSWLAWFSLVLWILQFRGFRVT